MSELVPGEVLGWTHPTTAIVATGLEVRGQATADQLVALAEFLGLLGLERLQARYKITQLPRGRFRLNGKLDAKVVQACVVTLDPVPADLRETFDVEFWPQEAVASARIKSGAGDQSVLQGDEPEPIVHNTIDAGRIVFETLAAALDPFPRAPHAMLELPRAHDETADGPTDRTVDGTVPAANGQTGASTHPFAALAKLVRKSD